MKIKIFKIKKHFRKGGLSAKPGFFWQILLFIAFVIILSSAIFGLSLFIKVNKEGVFIGNPGAKKPQVISKERIDRVLSSFSERAKKSNQILNSASSIVDPSL